MNLPKDNVLTVAQEGKEENAEQRSFGRATTGK